MLQYKTAFSHQVHQTAVPLETFRVIKTAQRSVSFKYRSNLKFHSCSQASLSLYSGFSYLKSEPPSISFFLMSPTVGLFVPFTHAFVHDPCNFLASDSNKNVSHRNSISTASTTLQPTMSAEFLLANVLAMP